jgi:hypothetical protein
MKSAKLKTWQHVSATTSHHQAKDRTNVPGLRFIFGLMMARCS